MNLTEQLESQEPLVTKRILSCTVIMDRKTMLEALLSEVVIIKGYKCKAPERELLERLINGWYGEMRLEFEIIE